VPLPDSHDGIPPRLLERTAALPAFRAPPRTAAHLLEARLHLNEPSFPPAPRVLEVLRRAEHMLGRYPDGAGTALRAALAARLGVGEERIVLGAGSDELIALSAAAFLAPGAHCVVPTPSFPRYRTCALLQGAVLTEVPVDVGGALDVDAMATAARGATLVFAASPNNPTGAMLAACELQRFVTRIDGQALLVLDEAYFEFGRAAGGPDGLQLLGERRGPWMVLRTFSKAYALAGLRVGYAVVSDPALAEALNRSRSLFNVSALAQAAALAALEDERYAIEQVGRTVASRERLRGQLEALGFTCLPSAANFLTVALPLPAGDAIAQLAAEGILVASVGPAPFDRHIRITVGSEADHARLLEALARLAGR
jgi:histidinol-phosphate aminotransferase